MSNTITFTFNNNLPIVGETITLSQIDYLGVESDLVFTYANDNIGSDIFIVIGSPQGNFCANQLMKTFMRSLNPSLYSVFFVANVVTVTALTNDFAFDGGTSDFDGVTITTNFTPLESDGLQRIHARSPYFISAPINDGGIKQVTKATFEIYIYEGVLDTSKPTTPTYTYEKKPRFAGDTNIYIDISRQISDYIDNKYNGTLQTDCVFVEVETTSTYSGGTITESKKFLALNGYNLHQENVNHIPKEIALLSNKTISVLYGESISIPAYLGFLGSYVVELIKNVGGVQEVIQSLNIDGLEIINTNDIVTYATFDNVTEGDYISVRLEGETDAVIFDVEIVTECIYNPVKITFINRFGVLQDFYAYKVSKQKLKSTNDNYNRSVLSESVIGGIPVLSYQTNEHNSRDYNKQSKRSIELNTGYIPEDNNVLIEEMLNSEYIWITLDEVIHPVNLSTKNISLLSKTNDQLIKYTINLEYSYNEVQNIR